MQTKRYPKRSRQPLEKIWYRSLHRTRLGNVHMGLESKYDNSEVDAVESGTKINRSLSRAHDENLIGELVSCEWLEGSVCIVLEREIRRLSMLTSYCIYFVHDFSTGERYWVDEEDLKKV